MSSRPVIGVDIGGTRLKAGLVATDGTILRDAAADTQAEVPGLLDRVIDLAASVAGDERPAAVGVATAGIVDTARGTIIGGSSNLPGWVGTDVAGGIRARLGLPAAVDNDVNAAALGESWRGAGQGARVLLGVMVGTGLGAGLVLDGRLYPGAYYAGLDISYEAVPDVPVGYYPNPHSAECAIGLAGLRWRLVQALRAGRATCLEPETLTPAALLSAADAGDELAAELWAEAVAALTVVLTNLTYVLDPDRVVLGGGVVEAAGDSLLERLRHDVGARLTPDRRARFDLRPMALGGKVGLLGGAKLAFDLLGRQTGSE